MEDRDFYYMGQALLEARTAYEEREVPVGAVLVLGDRIVARGHNQVELLKDATAHAEMLTLTVGSAAIGDWRLNEATLYCTLEPCSMCAGAMFLARLGRLVYGAPDLRHGAAGSWVDLFQLKHPMHTVELRRGVREAEAADLMRQFFQERRCSGK